LLIVVRLLPLKKFTVINDVIELKHPTSIIVTIEPMSTCIKLKPSGITYDDVVNVVSFDVDVVEFE
jgi:hypothetical protein